MLDYHKGWMYVGVGDISRVCIGGEQIVVVSLLKLQFDIDKVYL